MFNFSLQSVFMCTSVHDGKVLCHSSISESHLPLLVLQISIVFHSNQLEYSVSVLHL